MKSIKIIFTLSVIGAIFAAQSATAHPATTEDEIISVLGGANPDVSVDIMNNITFTRNITATDTATFMSDYSVVGGVTGNSYVLDGAGKYNGFILKSIDIGAASKSISIGNGITMQNFYSGIAGVNGAAVSAVDDTANVGVTILPGVCFIGNRAGGSGGAIAVLSTGGDTNVYIGPDTQFLNNMSGGRGGAIIFGSVNQTSQLVLNTGNAGQNILFDGNIDATGANDISVFNTFGTVYIEGSGSVTLNGGISSADATAAIIKSATYGNSVMTLGPDSNNTRFFGTFNQSSGATNVYANNFFAGTNNITNGSVLHFFNSATDVSLNMATGAILDMRADPAKAGQFNVLTISNLTSDGTMKLYSATNGTTADVLRLMNSATGNATVAMTVRPGAVGALRSSAADNGILVVDDSVAGLNGISTSKFALAGGAVDIGAFTYHLVQAADSNWYLQSPIASNNNNGNGGGNGGTGGGNNINNALNNTAKTVGAVPALHLVVVKEGMNELRKRLGDLRDENHDLNNGVWIRTFGKQTEVSDHINAKMTLGGVEAGIDRNKRMWGGTGYLGVMAGFMYSDNIRDNQGNTVNATGSARAPSAGIYATWLNKPGWFVDWTARYFWVDTHMHNVNSSGGLVNYDIERNLISTSLEGGRRYLIDMPYWMQFGHGCNSQMTLEPKAEVRYTYAPWARASTSLYDIVTFDATHSLDTRLALQSNWLPDGVDSVWKPFVEVAVYNEWLGQTGIAFDGTPFGSDIKGMGYEVSLGTNVRLSPAGAYAFGDVAYEQGQAFKIYSLNLGVRAKF